MSIHNRRMQSATGCPEEEPRRVLFTGSADLPGRNIRMAAGMAVRPRMGCKMNRNLSKRLNLQTWASVAILGAGLSLVSLPARSAGQVFSGGGFRPLAVAIPTLPSTPTGTTPVTIGSSATAPGSPYASMAPIATMAAPVTNFNQTGTYTYNYGIDSLGQPCAYIVVGSDPADYAQYVYGAPLGPGGIMGPPSAGVLYAPPGMAPLVFFKGMQSPPPGPAYTGPSYPGQATYGPAPVNTSNQSAYNGPLYRNQDNGFSFISNQPGAGTQTNNSTAGRSQPAVLPTASSEAIVDIQEAWILADPSLITKHLDAAHPVWLYKDGQLETAVSTKDYLARLQKAIDATSTQSFVLSERAALPSGLVAAWGRQVYYDANNQRLTSYPCYWLAHAGGQWIVVAVNEAGSLDNAFFDLRPVRGSLDRGSSGAPR